MRLAALLPLALLAGCASDTRDLMPLAEGLTWEYLVRLDGDETTETMRATKRAPVGRLEGWQLESGMGRSRLAWDGDTLYAAELAGTTYAPPVPLLANQAATWRGVVTTANERMAGTATLERSTEALEVAGRRRDTVKTVLTLECAGERIQLTTWFFSGMGILRQEQRRGSALTRDRYIECVDGPP